MGNIATSKQAGIVFLVTLVISAGFFQWAPANILNKSCGDCEGGYIATAKNYLEGRGWVDTNGDFEVTRPPGHALIILSLIRISNSIGVSEKLIYRLFNAVIMGISSILLLMIGRKVWSNQNVIAVPFIWITCPFVLWFLNQPYSEVPFFLSFYGCIVFTLYSYQTSGKRRCAFALGAGVAVSLSMMIRPIAIGIPLVLFLGNLLATSTRGFWKHMQYLIMLTIGILIVLAPWSAIIYKNTGHWMLLTDGDLATSSLINGVTFATRGDDYRMPLKLPEPVRQLMLDVEARLVATRDEKQIGGQKVINVRETSLKRHLATITKVLRDDPVASLQLLGIKLTRSWYGTDSHRNETLSRILVVTYLFLVLIGAYRGMKLAILRREYLIISGLLLLYFWMMATLFEPLLRYMVPLLGLLFVFLPGLWLTKPAIDTERSHSILN